VIEPLVERSVAGRARVDAARAVLVVRPLAVDGGRAVEVARC
jgi:hypothetical protein